MRIGFDMQALIGGGATGLGAYARGILWAMERIVSGELALPDVRRDLPGRLAEEIYRIKDWPKGIEVVRLYPNRLEKPLARTLERVWWEQVSLKSAANAEKADVVYSPALGAPLRSDVANVMTVHDLIPLHKKHREFKLSELYFTEYLPRCCKKAEYLVFDTETVRAEFLGRWPDVTVDKTLVVACFPACRVPSLWPPTSGGGWNVVESAKSLAKPIPGHAERRGFACVATFEERKNLGLALDAYSHLDPKVRDVHPLILVGKGGDEREILWQLVEASGLARFVKLTGYISDVQLHEVYRNALALVFPSTDEGFGIPPLEAMSFGAPAIIGDAPAVREVYGAVCPSVARDASDNLAGEMARLVKYPEHWSKLSADGMRFAAQFTPERAAVVALAACTLAKAKIH